MPNYEPSYQVRITRGDGSAGEFCQALADLMTYLASEIANDNIEWLVRNDYETAIVLEISDGGTTGDKETTGLALGNAIHDINQTQGDALSDSTLEPEPEPYVAPDAVPDQAPLRHFHVFERGSGVVPALVLNVASEGEALNFFARENWQTMRQRVDLRDFHAVEFQQPNQACILLVPRKVNPTIPSEQPRPDEPPSRAPPGASKAENA